MTAQPWLQTTRADRTCAALADRHYSRQAPGTRQFTPPGRVLVLLAVDGDAVWATSWPYPQYVNRLLPGAWVNSLFRTESTEHRASDLIRAAVAVTRWYWPNVPAEGIVTLIDRTKVRPTRARGRDTWGYCYRRVGFRDAGETQGGLLVLQLLPDDMPLAMAPLRAQLVLPFEEVGA